MSRKILLFVAILALFVAAAMGESAIEKLKSKIESGAAAAPCDKAAAPAGPAPPKQFLDQRLPLVVDDYHPPKGGFNPSHIPDKEVDVAARKILREIEAAEAEAKANGLPTPGSEGKKDDNGVLTTEEHKYMKQLLLDADILVRAAAKSLSENGPVEAETARNVAKSAVKKAAAAAKKKIKKDAKKADKAVQAPGPQKEAKADKSDKAAKTRAQVGKSGPASGADKSKKAKDVRTQQ